MVVKLVENIYLHNVCSLIFEKNKHPRIGKFKINARA